MAAQLDSAVAAEEARIRDAYLRRPSTDRYSCFSQGHLFLVQERERRVLATLKREGILSLDAKRILEIGCGTGFWVREFIKWGAVPHNITGLDLLPDRIVDARQLCPQGVSLQCGSATQLPFRDQAFDIVLQSTVFTSILDVDTKRLIAAEMIRVLKKTGIVIWYDYHVNNPWNADVRGITKAEIRELFPDCRISLRHITPAPPLLRLLAPYSWLGCYLLGRIPWLCTHFLGVIRRQEERTLRVRSDREKSQI